MVSFNILGLNCGTSIDGIDVAHCRISAIDSSADVTIDLLAYTEVPVHPDLRAQVLRLCRPNQDEAATTLAEVCDLNFALGREFSRAIEQSGISLDDIDLIASHGQTLWHQPRGDQRSTLQMAEPAVIAQRTGRTVVSGFRVAELAAGRQGAPLAGFFEAALLSDSNVTRIIQNIGGIGNATILPTCRSSANSYLAFDTGPGNILIDAAMRILTNNEQQYDRDGELGAAGEADINLDLVFNYMTQESYFQQHPPKTTGRELFSDDVARSMVNRMRAMGMSTPAIIATITRITAESIARAYEDFSLPLIKTIDEIYICGGGAYNPNILKHLKQRFPKSRILKLDEAPIRMSPSAKEAVMFALLGFLGLCGRTVPTATDAETTHPVILGVITPGENYPDLLKKVVADPGFGQWGVLGRVSMR